MSASLPPSQEIPFEIVMECKIWIYQPANMLSSNVHVCVIAASLCSLGVPRNMWTYLSLWWGSSWIIFSAETLEAREERRPHALMCVQWYPVERLSVMTVRSRAAGGQPMFPMTENKIRQPKGSLLTVVCPHPQLLLRVPWRWCFKNFRWDDPYRVQLSQENQPWIVSYTELLDYQIWNAGNSTSHSNN